MKKPNFLHFNKINIFEPIKNMLIWKKLFFGFALANCISVVITILILLQINAFNQQRVNWDKIATSAQGAYLSNGKEGLAIFAHALEAQNITINLIKNGDPILNNTGDVIAKDYAKKAIQGSIKYTDIKINQQTSFMGIDLSYLGFDRYYFVGIVTHSPLESKALNTLWLELILSLIFIALMGYWVASKIANPILSIKEAANSLGGGELNTKIDESKFNKDEVGELAVAFNKMSHHINQTITNKKQLLWNISHELRSPLNRLNFILTLLQDASSNEAPSAKTEYIQKAKDEITNLDQIIEATLTLSRLEHNYESTEKECIVLQQFIQERIEAIQSYKEEKNITFKQLFYPPQEVTILANPLLLSMVIDNIFDNAFKFSPKNSCIEVKIEKILNTDKNIKSLNNIVLEICDEGIGIPEDELTKIFQPFFRSSKSKNIEGYGLGLSIVKQIVDLHGGKIIISNLFDKGLSVKILFPAYQKQGL